MKLRAIVSIKHSGKWIEPGKGFDCSKDDAAALIECGAAVPFDSVKSESNDPDNENNNPETGANAPDPFAAG
jgi:hypothetical protein